MTSRSAGVIGTGLIGGSIAAGLVEAGWSVAGYDPDPDVRSKAQSLGLVDHTVGSIDAVVDAEPDLIVVAAPPKATIEVLSSLGTTTTVMDVSAVKTAILAAGSHLPGFVGTHPMAGRETSGPRAASAALFQGASWVVVEGAAPGPAETVVEVVSTLGARPIHMTADEHDRAVALISHLPHLVAGALLSAVEQQPGSLDLAAGSFRDLTRVASSQPLPWVEILKTNDRAVLAAVGAMRETLAAIESAIVSEDDSLLSLLDAARETRAALGSPVAQVRIALADKPGELARVGHAFETAGVDIRDIQMRHAPYGGGGVLTLAVRQGEQGALVHALERENLLILP
ncbi:MAG: prephenate dehydrogenase/arogenate dehydrogenase family protein [Acidimicrobiia bacterium]